MTIIHAGIFRSGNYYQGVIKLNDKASIKSEYYDNLDDAVKWVRSVTIL